MRLIGSSTDPVDPIDAVLDGADRDQADLLAVAAVVHDVLAAYTRSEPLEVREELAAYCGAHPVRSPSGEVGAAAAVVAPTGARTTRKRGAMLRRLAAFTGTVAGKVILTSTVAAACAGGLHAAGAVDVPALPDADKPDEQPEPIGSHARQEPDPVDRDAPASTDADERHDGTTSTDDESDDGWDGDGWDDDRWDDDGWDDDREVRSDDGDYDDVDDGEGDAATADERDDGDGSSEPADAAGPTSDGSAGDSDPGR